MNANDILNELLEGNARYCAGNNTTYDYPSLRSETKDGQSPKAYVLSCIDSRVPVETVFDQAIGDLFIGRVAGNVADTDQLASMEFAVCAVNVPLLIVMGHSACGAVKGACGGVELGNLTSLLKKITPACEAVTHNTPPTAEELTDITKKNVENTLSYIRANSPDLSIKENAGDLKIVGAYYNLESGKVEIL